MQHVSPQEFAPLDRIFNLSGEEYFDLLHPEGTHGQPKVLVKFRDNTYKSFSLNRDQCRLQMHADSPNEQLPAAQQNVNRHCKVLARC